MGPLVLLLLNFRWLGINLHLQNKEISLDVTCPERQRRLQFQKWHFHMRFIGRLELGRFGEQISQK